MELEAYFNADVVGIQNFEPEDFLEYDNEQDVVNAILDSFNPPSIPFSRNCVVYVDCIDDLVSSPNFDEFINKWKELKIHG